MVCITYNKSSILTDRGVNVMNSHSPLPTDLYRAVAVRELDRQAIEEQGIPGFTLMRRAAKAAFNVLQAAWPEVENITIVCGTGNNGGDGYVMASIARQQGIAVRVVQCGDADKIRGDALQARQLALQDGVEVIPLTENLMIETGVIVDAVLGTGLIGAVRAEARQAIDMMNSSACPVLAVDVPSGLCSDTGRLMASVAGDQSAAVYAEHTVSFIGLKQGLLTGDAPAYCGQLHFFDLQVPAAVYQQVDATAQRLDLAELTAASLAPRPRTAHKGHFGHVLVAGGDFGMAGAVIMASQAAGRVGAGLISCATRAEHLTALNSRCPEIMAHGVSSGQELAALLPRASVVAVGPGLGQSAWSEQLLQQVCKLSVPLVIDADALNLLAAGRVVKNAYRDNWVLTPHPGEAARLLNCSVAEIQQDRFAAVNELQCRFGGAVILKGAGSLVAASQYSATGVCMYGNPGMATGGMGDVLSGVLAALLAQGLSVADAARLAVCLHGAAADLAAADGQRGLLATDLLPHLRRLVNQVISK